MIRIVRENEPSELTAVRALRLPEMALRVKSGEPLKSEHFKDYGVAKPALLDSSAHKCWYCEKMGDKLDEVDHFRPKTRARRGESHPPGGYWWLAWTWENLLFACTHCNRIKGTKFPLTASSTPLREGEEPPGDEVTLLLDPSVHDPLDHIRFVRDDEKSQRWRPIGKTPEGKVTIEVLELDGHKNKRTHILNHYRDHIINRVLPRLERFQELWKSGKHDDAQEAWERLCIALLSRSSPYAALAYDALNVLVPPEQRAVFPVPRPPYALDGHVAT